MKTVRIRTISSLIILALILSLFTFYTPQETDAAGFSTAYPNTYVNTGAGANDIVGVAKTQIGYQENSVGTKYGDWYNTVFVKQPWCAMFVSWCAGQAKIPNSVIKKFSSCSVQVAWFKSIGRWQNSRYYGGDYTPQKGDIVFYRDGGSSAVSTHVGIMVGLNGNYLNVIEGNATNAKVCQFTSNKSRTLTSSYVIGYGTPNYSYQVQEEPTTYETWEVTADALTIRSSHSTSSDRLGAVTIGNLINVTQFKLADGYLWGYTTYAKKKGWVALNYCNYINGNINGVYYQLPPTVSPKLLDLYVNNTKTLVVTNGLGAKFKSSDKTIVKVSKKGKLTALKPGTATITCKTATGSATCTVTVADMNISKTYVEVCAGDKTSLKVTGAKGTITWKTKSSKIASISSTGVIKGVKPGTTYVVAKLAATKFRCDVKVTSTPTTYEIFRAAKKTYLRDDYKKKNKLLVIPKYTYVKVKKVKYTDTYTWGKIKYAGKVGWIVLNHFKYKSGSFGTKKYKPKAFLKKSSKKMYLATKYQLDVRYATAPITYSSDNKKIAKISKKGVVKAVKAGTTYVNATFGKTTLKCKIKVKNPKISATSLDMLKGNQSTLTISGGSGDIAWSSSKSSVAKVSKTGVITAKKYGKATITAIRNKIKLTCDVSVVDPKLSETKASMKVGDKKQLTLSDCDVDTAKWKSSNINVLTITKTGEVEAIAPGSSVITVTVNGVKLKCEITVK